MTSATFSLKRYPSFSSYSSWASRVRSFLFPENESDRFIPNYRWTPIVSGVVIPFSILLEIPGLTERWYVRTENNKTVETRRNPVILDVGMAFSMACALIANICLVMRFLERRVLAMTILCIIFLTIHDIINIIAVTTFGIEHRFDDGFTYGQSFWITLCSTIASTFTNVTLVYDLVRTPNFAASGSGLTRKQRGLVIVVIVLIVYIAFGGLFNSLLLHLSFIDGLYFTIESVETIGFGDIKPDSTGSRVFICFYVAIGLVNIGMAVAMCRETVLEGLTMSYRKRVRALRQRRREAKRFRRWEKRWRRAVEWRLREKGQPVWVTDNEDARLHDGVRFVGLPGSAAGRPERHLHGHPSGKHLNLNALSNAELEEAALEAGVPLELFLDPGPRRYQDALAVAGREGAAAARAGTHGDPWPPEPATPTHAQLGRMAAVLTKVALAISGRQTDEKENGGGGGGGRDPALERYARVPKWLLQFRHGALHASRFSYEELEESMRIEEKRAHYAKLIVAWSLFFLFWIIGSAIFSSTEGWSFGIAMYFCFVAFSTIGFGDFSPQTPAGRSIFVVWALFGVGTLTILVSVLEEAGSSRYKSALHSHVFDRAVRKFRQKEAREIAQVLRGHALSPDADKRASHGGVGANGPPSAISRQHEPESPEAAAKRVKHAQEIARRELEELPGDIIKQTRAFYDSIQFFLGSGSEEDVEDPVLTAQEGPINVPEELRRLLDEIATSEGIGERLKREILQDEDARKVR
ncbi:voltage-gated potassium channel [Obba rivulosa]|uniref:Voltage-gated potassium channel n=1 Tax=Obba rivulosa TaxID=1052685 RepID=A0A8E2DIL9_9APHY|nr:voltage-gated potassium channel [Obba rivulosa]